MKAEFKDQPREFHVKEGDVSIKDYGKLYLDDNELISLRKESGAECDIVAKDWGYYLTPSINGRLKREGFKTALVKNDYGQIFINAVETSKVAEFEKYLITEQNCVVLAWLDEWTDEQIQQFQQQGVS